MTETNQDANGKSSGNKVLTVIVVILGVIAVILLGIFLAGLFGDSSEAPAPTVIPPTPAPGVPTVTTMDYVNIRSGPGNNYPVYGVVAPGTSGEAIGTSADGQWYSVKVPTEIIASGNAWVSADYVVAQNTENLPTVPAPPPPPTVPPPSPAPGSATVTALTAINVRSGPGTNYDIYGVAPQGTVFEAIGISSDGGWYAVKIPTEYAASGTGWVSASYVKADNIQNLPVIDTPAPPADVIPPPPDPGGPTAVNFEPINVRSGPSSQYPSYGVAPIGTVFKVTGVSADGSWWVVAIPPIIAPNGQGWINAAYVNTANTANVPVVESPPL
jgi:uncharacterized protein YraI